jgi:uncharacterized membrane protein
MNTLIPAEATTLLWAAVLVVAALGYLAERKTSWGRKFSGVMVALTGAIVLSNLRIIPTESAVYDTIFDSLLPIAIPLLLFRTDLRRVIKEAGPSLFAFTIGTVGIVVGTLIALLIVPLGDLAAPMAGMFSATYIGGSVNFFAVAEAAGFSRDDTLIAAIAADNMATNVYLVALIAIPGVAFFRKHFASNHIDAVADDHSAVDDEIHNIQKLDIIGLLFALALAFFVAFTGQAIADYFSIGGFGIVFVTALALIIAAAFPKLITRLSGDREAGNVMILLFLTAIGASADIWKMVEFGPALFIFAMILITIHMLIVFIAGYVFKIDLAELLVASSACIGGASSAGAIASAKGWNQLVTPGILLGSVGNGVGTFIGISLYGALL